MSDGFQRVLDHIRSIAGTEAEKGRLFERDLIAAFRRIVQVSVETVAVVESLPCPFFEPEAQPDGERP